MVIAWIGYCLLIAALLGLAAFASERALGHFRKPVRWAWLAAIIGSVTAPVVAFVAPGLFPAAAPPLAPMANLGDLVVVGPGPAAPGAAASVRPGAGLDAGGRERIPGLGMGAAGDGDDGLPREGLLAAAQRDADVDAE